MYYDEVYFVKTANQIIHLNGYTDTVQPPLGKLLIALSIFIFGDHTWAWRLVSLLCGFGCLMILYTITRQLTKSDRTAFFTSLLFGLDGVSFTQARIGMLNSPMYFFMFLSVWFLMKHVVTKEWSRQKAFFFSGLFFAFSVAVRLIGLSVTIILLIFYWELWKKEKDKTSLIKETSLYFILIPFLVYESTFLVIPFIQGFNWFSIWHLQVHMFKYHLQLKQTHIYGSEWWSWPLMLRPIWYFYRSSQISGISMVHGIICIGNPLIFWLMPVAMAVALKDFFKNRTLFNVFIIVGFFTQWLQWAPVSRVKFFHYIYTVMPFAEIAFAIILDRLWQKNAAGRVAVCVYLALVIVMFFYWYPLYNGTLITEAYFRQHMWFRSWI